MLYFNEQTNELISTEPGRMFTYCIGKGTEPSENSIHSDATLEFIFNVSPKDVHMFTQLPDTVHMLKGDPMISIALRALINTQHNIRKPVDYEKFANTWHVPNVAGKIYQDFVTGEVFTDGVASDQFFFTSAKSKDGSVRWLLADQLAMEMAKTEPYPNDPTKSQTVCRKCRTTAGRSVRFYILK